jgi:hypothetical protein
MIGFNYEIRRTIKTLHQWCYACLGAALAQGFQKKLAVLDALKNWLAPVPPVHDVIKSLPHIPLAACAA